jgi:glycolate oxidase FAD binding subunit
MPDADFIAAPSTAEEVAELLAQATEYRLKVLVWGGGSHQGYGYRFEPDVVISTSRLNRIIVWEPDDLTLVAEAGATVADLEARVDTRGQTAMLPEVAGAATLGGVLATGLSGYRRGRFGPTRDRILETTIVTGDGRVIRAGGRVVKNVTGYDLPRLVVGSFGSLGIIVSACLKLWPQPGAVATVKLADPERAALVYRPMAVLRDPESTRVYLGGTTEEVAAQIDRLGGIVSDQFDWPAPVTADYIWSLRVPPSLISEAIDRLPAGSSYLAQMLVGEVTFGTDWAVGISSLRAWAESVHGALVVVAQPPETYDSIDPWGTPPAALELQRRLIAAFDPARVINPGRLPGAI